MQRSQQVQSTHSNIEVLRKFVPEAINRFNALPAIVQAVLMGSDPINSQATIGQPATLPSQTSWPSQNTLCTLPETGS